MLPIYGCCTHATLTPFLLVKPSTTNTYKHTTQKRLRRMDGTNRPTDRPTDQPTNQPKALRKRFEINRCGEFAVFFCVEKLGGWIVLTVIGTLRLGKNAKVMPRGTWISKMLLVNSHVTSCAAFWHIKLMMPGPIKEIFGSLERATKAGTSNSIHLETTRKNTEWKWAWGWVGKHVYISTCC